MRKLYSNFSILTLSATILVAACSKQETQVKDFEPNPQVPDSVFDVPPTTNPGNPEVNPTDPICPIPLAFPVANTADQNENNIGKLIEQPSWTPSTQVIPAPEGFEPPIMMCLFVSLGHEYPKASLRLEYEDSAGRVQYTLKTHNELDYSNRDSNNVPQVKTDENGDNVLHEPTYFVQLDQSNFELFFMPTWGFITIKGALEADGKIHAKVHYIKINEETPIEPYYLSYGGGTDDVTKIQSCTGDDMVSNSATIVHPDRPTDPEVGCSQAHRLVMSAFRGPVLDYTRIIFDTHYEYTGAQFTNRIDLVRQYTDESAQASTDFMTAYGQKPTLLGTIKFNPEQVWAGEAP